MDSLAKKYDEKFKAAAEVNAQLAVENAKLRDAQVVCSNDFYETTYLTVLGYRMIPQSRCGGMCFLYDEFSSLIATFLHNPGEEVGACRCSFQDGTWW